MKQSLLLVLVLFSASTFAREFFRVKPKQYDARVTDALAKIEQAFKVPKTVVRRFNPTGAVISNKVVKDNEITFDAKKTIMMISKTVKVKARFDIEESSQICDASQLGYIINVDLTGSDELIYDNVENLEAHVCLKELNKSQVNITVSGKMYRGASYSKMTGGIARDMIEGQIEPLIEALKEEIRN